MFDSTVLLGVVMFTVTVLALVRGDFVCPI